MSGRACPFHVRNMKTAVFQRLNSVGQQLRKIFGPKRSEIAEQLRILCRSKSEVTYAGQIRKVTLTGSEVEY